MRLKAFLSTYVLFLCVLFSIIGIVSVYMTNSQMNMLREKSIREYQTISASLARDIAALYGHHAGRGEHFHMGVETLMRGYAMYYRRYNISVYLAESQDIGGINAELAFIQREQEHFIHIAGVLPEPFGFFRLDYTIDITDSITDMQHIQRILLVLSVAFSAIAALGLYFILLKIFKPLKIVADASRDIADGNYDRRIGISGNNELSAMAGSFNQMAGKIENQICILKEEALAKQQFIDNFAHEIRTPLTSIYGYAEYTQKAPLDEDTIIKSTQTIMDEASHMKSIAESLLKLATLRNYTPVTTEIPVMRLFEEVTQTLKVPLICKSSDVDFLRGQEDLIKSLILNLCSNAIKAYSPESIGDICLEAEKRGDKVVISITDKGCGIAAEDMSKITEPFYRADKARTRAHGGVGLGLTLCKQIAEVHGAAMHIESAIGVGTTVSITFTKP